MSNKLKCEIMKIRNKRKCENHRISFDKRGGGKMSQTVMKRATEMVIRNDSHHTRNGTLRGDHLRKLRRKEPLPRSYGSGAWAVPDCTAMSGRPVPGRE